MTTLCRVCLGASCEPWMDFGLQPNSVRLLASADEPEALHPLALLRCPACGFICLADTQPPEAFYGDTQMPTSFSPARHFPALIRDIQRLLAGIPAPRIFEIGGNDGFFLAQLREAGFQNLAGIEPADGCAAQARERGLAMETGYFSLGWVQSRVAAGLAADLVLCRHVLEHILDLDDFICGMTAMLAEGGQIVLEVPDLSASLLQGDFSTLWEQHANYFELGTLARLLSRHGLRIRTAKALPHGGGALLAFLERGPSSQPLPPPVDASQGAARFQANMANLRSTLSRLTGQGRRIVAFGAGMRGTMLINLAGAGPFLEGVLDDNPAKIGHFLPGSRLPIKPSRTLLADPPDLCLVLPLNAKEAEYALMERSAPFRAAGGTFLEVLPADGSFLKVLEDGPTCHACGAPCLKAIDGLGAFRPVSSDIRLVDGRLTLGHCMRCGLLQKQVDHPWREAVARVYAEYAINHQGGGSDPFIFTSRYGPGSRATILAVYLNELLALPGAGRLLDIGCANGNILRKFAAAHPGWELAGLENSDRWRETVLAIPGVKAFYRDPADLPRGQFDLIVLSHVLEHIPDPASYLAALIPALSASGRLFLAVPDIRQNPIDLLVLDHCSHFDEAVMASLLARAGFQVLSIRSDILGKELVAAAQPGIDPLPQDSATSSAMPLPQAAEKFIGLYRDLADQARSLRATCPCFGVMGTSTAAGWIAGELGEEVDFFADEDPDRIGGIAFGKPILSLGQIPPGACLFIPMSSATAEAIISRSGRDDLVFGYVPWNQIDDVRIAVKAPQPPRDRPWPPAVP